VLASLNVALFYIDQAKFGAASRTMDNFESCVAQFPLRNGEEHRVLVELARGRIDLHTGKIDQAVSNLEKTLEGRQWFGKIGTDEADLKAGAMISLAQALHIRVNHRALTLSSSLSESADNILANISDKFRAWWLFRRARQILSDDLTNLEDIHIRNTDSLIEYPTFGDLLSGFPLSVLQARIKNERISDTRTEAAPYYNLYLAEKKIDSFFSKNEGLKEAEDVMQAARPKFDELLKLKATTDVMSHIDKNSLQYEEFATRAFHISRAALRNAGLPLPVNYQIDDEELAKQLAKTGFDLDNSRDRVFRINGSKSEDKYTLTFRAADINSENITVSGKNLIDLINKFNDAVLTTPLG